MRTGGAGLSQSSESWHAAANAGPAVATGAIGCSTCRGVFCSGTTIGNMVGRAASRSASALADIAGAVDVDDASSRRCGGVDRQPADRLGDLVGGGDAAERDVG